MLCYNDHLHSFIFCNPFDKLIAEKELREKIDHYQE